MKHMTLLFLVLCSAWAAQASPICFSDSASYNRVKAQLPPSMQGGKITLGAESSKLAAAVQIIPGNDGLFHFHMAYRHWLVGQGKDAGRIRQICVSGNVATVTLASGTQKQLKIQGNSFSYEGNVLSPVSSKQFSQLLSRINGAKPGAGGGQGSAGQN